ncbi:AbgT family transporter [Corynebacterium diphtheriae]|nr:AbgT family transporter [Corynebacterium diphtheriae]
MSTTTTTPPHKTAPSGFLGRIEQLGNRLPDPFWIFVFLAIVVAISSWIGSAIGMTAVNPQDGSTVEVTNLLTKEGATKMVNEAVNNFVAFPPLGVIITVMLGFPWPNTPALSAH